MVLLRARAGRFSGFCNFKNSKFAGLAGTLCVSLLGLTGCIVRGESTELVLKGSVAESSEVVQLDPVFLSRQKEVESRFFGFDSVSQPEARPGISSADDDSESDVAATESDVDVPVRPEMMAPYTANSGANAFSSLNIRWPLKGHITSPFGIRHGRLHAGVDIKGAKGEPIYSAADGQILTAKRKNAYGIVAVVGHDNDHQTLYGHMMKLAVREGQFVRAGQLIGYVGKTGRATGYHLHFETRVAGGIPQDPLRFLPDVKRHIKVSLLDKSRKVSVSQ